MSYSSIHRINGVAAAIALVVALTAALTLTIILSVTGGSASSGGQGSGRYSAGDVTASQYIRDAGQTGTTNAEAFNDIRLAAKAATNPQLKWDLSIAWGVLNGGAYTGGAATSEQGYFDQVVRG